MVADVAEIVGVAMQKGVAPKFSCTLAHLSRIRFLQGWQLCRWVIRYDIACALIWYDELLSVNPCPLGWLDQVHTEMYR